MISKTDYSLDCELKAFSVNNWEENKVFSFAILNTQIKRDQDGQWFISHDANTEIVLDSSIVPAGVFFPIDQHDHFLSIKKDDDSVLFLFIPTKSSLEKRDGFIGASIIAEKYTHTFKGRNGISGIEDLTFTINPSEFVGLYGESGIGKSVLINSILGTLPEGTVKGNLFIKNSCGDIVSKDDISYLPQTVDIPKQLLCIEILRAAMIDRSIDCNCKMQEIKDTLSRCSLDESILYKSYRQISEGQKRRLCIASTLLKKHSKLLIADEPTTGLDAYSEEQVMETLRSISRSGITVLVVTHSVISAPIMDRVIVLRKIASNCGATICLNGHVGKNQLDIISMALRGNKDIPSSLNEYHFPIKNFPAQKNDPPISVKNCFVTSKLIIFQSAQWIQNIVKTIYRDRKGILGFGILSLVCALTIQFGTNSYSENNAENIMLTLFTLAAPWLCAMFAAISVSELNRYFAWEHFSGLKSPAYLIGTVFAHSIPAFAIALIFTFGFFFSPRNSEIVNYWITRDISEDTTEDLILRRLWFVKDINNLPELVITEDMPEGYKTILRNGRNEEIEEVKKDRKKYVARFLRYITTAKNIKQINDNIDNPEKVREILDKTFVVNSEQLKYIRKTIDKTQWFNNKDLPIVQEVQKELDMLGITVSSQWYSPILTFYSDLKADYKNYPKLGIKEIVPKRGNYPIARGKARDLPQSEIYIFCVVLFRMWCISWIGSIIGISSAVVLESAKNAAISIIVLFIFYILFSRIFISDLEAAFYLQPLAEISTNFSTIDNLGLIIPVCCSFVSLGRYSSNYLAYAFTDASLVYDKLALCLIAFSCILLSLVFLTKKRISK